LPIFDFASGARYPDDMRPLSHQNRSAAEAIQTYRMLLQEQQGPATALQAGETQFATGSGRKAILCVDCTATV
jgi:hypothetical protein